MFFHPVNILFMGTLIFSLCLIFSMNTWVMVWLGLELNLLSFIPIMLKKNNKYNVEAGLKYFLIQSLGSMYLLMSFIFGFLMFSKGVSFFILVALFMKMGAAPTHSWFPSVIEGLTWPHAFVLMTLQKLGPLSLIPFVLMNSSSFYIVYFYLVSSALVGAVMGLNQSSLRKILAFSSINHTGWMLACCCLTKLYWIIYILVYSLILVPIILVLYKLQLFFINHVFKIPNFFFNIMFSVSFMSLGGLPPFTGFMLKLLVVKELINFMTNYFILFILLFSSFFSLFYYFRLMLYYFMLSFTNSINFFFFNKFSFFLVMLNVSGIFILVFFYFI
uniref:NADH-ubiquinone oxidoreductase chain 2 n=1 Tax=Halice sp. JL-2018 TaxID=2528348 RepID=A0A3Q8M7G6_9CRUS|nr:NADH dehydrogenase subunit 2 [Halice sp. JL-2018]